MTTYTSCILQQVNNNGILSFGRPISRFLTIPFPIPFVRIIAPFWADVDTRLGPISGAVNNTDAHRVWYREVVQDEQLLMRVQAAIRAAFVEHPNFTPNWMFIATWDEVGYYNRHTDKVCLLHSLFQWQIQDLQKGDSTLATPILSNSFNAYSEKSDCFVSRLQSGARSKRGFNGTLGTPLDPPLCSHPLG